MDKRAIAPPGSSILSSGKTRFILVGLLSFILDLAFWNILYSQGYSLNLAHIVSFLSVSGIAYFLNTQWSFRDEAQFPASRWLHVVTVVLLLLFLRGGILAFLVHLRDFSPEAAIGSCAAVSALLSSLIGWYDVFSDDSNMARSEISSYRFAAGLILYAVLLRFFYLGLPELFFEEAYYWDYAKHLDIGYLDHPPMVAWIIALFTGLMGDNEFAVRFGAFVCWLIAGYFCYRLSCDIHSRARAYQAILLFAVLPAYFATGLVMTPDAPLVACWSAMLFFLNRALIDEQRMAWLGVGIAFGLGLLSKYPMVLMGPAVLLFVLFDRRARQWLFRPEPYWAVLLAAVLFLPVIVWNANHQWISFLYQSHDRAAKSFEFFLPDFIGYILLIITPTGLLSAVAVLFYRKVICGCADMPAEEAPSTTLMRRYRLLATLTLFPIAVFATISLFRETKFHWTVPYWLGLVPYMAVLVTPTALPTTSQWLDWTRRAWPATIVICLLCYGSALHYLSLGFPGVPYPKNLFLLGWPGLGRDIEAIVDRVERETGEKILVVGMDRNRIASGLAFYRTKAIEAQSSPKSIERQPAFDTAGRHLFGGKSLMYEYWFPSEEQNNKTMLLVSRKASPLTDDNIRLRAQPLGQVQELTFTKNGQLAGLYHYLLVKNYLPGQLEGNTSVPEAGD